MRYTVVLLPDEETGQLVAYVPAIPGCVTQGATVEDALRMARDAAQLVLEDMAETGEELPTETGTAMLGSVDVATPAATRS